MFIAQTVGPFLLVFSVFILGHFFVSNEGSGIYLPETDWDGELETLEELEEQPIEELDPTRYDSKTGQLLPDKYNYLKVENVFSGKIVGSENLFSIEVALLTKQPSIASDLFIERMRELEPDLVKEITTVILEVEIGQLEALDGRKALTEKIRKHINSYLVGEDIFPGITEVYIINFNVI